MQDFEGMEKVREALSFLLKDEVDAVDGYDRVLNNTALNEEDRVKLERIRNAEIDHIKDLSDMYQKYSTAKIVGTDSLSVKDYSARGSFNTIGELKSHYSGASLLLSGDNVTVVLKSGAELTYSYANGGKLLFVRGKN